MTRLSKLLARLRADRRGAAIVEFAIVSPVMMILLMGLGDLLYQQYAQSILNGAVQKAARDSTLEGANTTTIDTGVSNMVKTIAKNATFVMTRKSYDTFTQVAPEPFTDTNSNGIRNVGECYSDTNGNSQWDADPGSSGNGGASDVTLYTVTVTYPHIFPVMGLLGWPSTQTISAKTLLKNQPYAVQSVATPATICT